MKLSKSAMIALGGTAAGLSAVGAVSAGRGMSSFYRKTMGSLYPQNFTATNPMGDISSTASSSMPSPFTGMKFSFRRK